MTTAMLALVKYKGDGEATSDITAYLRSQQLFPIVDEGREVQPTSFERFTNILTEELESVGYQEAQAGAALLRAGKRLFTPEFRTAQAQFNQVMDTLRGKCLVMVDSVEQYQLGDKVSRSVVTALIEAVREFSARTDSRIIAKAAFPSELYPHLSVLNKEKTDPRNIFVLWGYGDLVSLLAMRYRRMLVTMAKSAGNTDGSSYEELADFKAAHAFMYKYLPQEVTSRSNTPFDTLAYIVRHTQKKPRQVILLMNTILTVVRDKGQDPFAMLEPATITDGVHARLDLLVGGALQIYDNIYPEAELLVKQSLTGAKSHFDVKTLDVYLKQISGLRQRHELATDQIKRLLLESGVLGIWHQQHPLRHLTPQKSLVEGLFEYQVKGTLVLTGNSTCVIHPMFYEELHTDVDADNFVYPVPEEDEERKSVQEKLKIKLT